MRRTTLSLLLIMTVLLQGCTGVIIGAAAAAGVAGSAVVFDQRSFQTVKNDQLTSLRIQRAIGKNPVTANSNISVATFHRIVLLVGHVKSPHIKDEAEKIAFSMPHVKRVANEISLQPPLTTLNAINDSWITTKVKTQMLAKKGLESGSFKVVTEDGVVYLMGIVTREQAKMAINVARNISGVQKVVTIFEYKKPV